MNCIKKRATWKKIQRPMEKSKIEKAKSGPEELQQMLVNSFIEVGALGPSSAGFFYSSLQGGGWA